MDSCVSISGKALHASADDFEGRGATSAWEDIMVDPDSAHTHTALLPVLERDGKSTHHGSTIQPPKRVSVALFKQLTQMESHVSARIIASNARTRPGHVFINTADHATDISTYPDLEHAVNDTHHRRDFQWLAIEHVEDRKLNDAETVQLRPYIATPRAYRPDLPIELDLEVPMRPIKLIPLDTCNMLTLATGGAECDTLYPARIATLDWNSDPDPSLRYNAQHADFVYCDVLGFASPCRLEHPLTPHIARASGRVPFAAFQIPTTPTATAEASEAFVVHAVKGSWELSRRENARNKKNLLQSLHRNCWLSGLVHLHGNDDGYPQQIVHVHIQLSPCILMTDPDHVFEARLLRGSSNVGREATGTPMFIAIELSDYSQHRYRAGFFPDLKHAFVETQALPEAAFRLALPQGDDTFMAKFLQVMKAEREREDPYPLTSKPVHHPRHDVQSAFWVFFWVAVRALPRDPSLERPSGAEIDAFSRFCKTMLDHVISDDVSDQRSDHMKCANFERLFHPVLRPFVRLFETMALYFAVPWHYYEEKKMVDPNHAHVAVLRLLLHFELELETTGSAMLNLALDTAHPRVMARTEVERASALPGGRLSHVRTSGCDSELSGFTGTGSSTSSRKRKANAPTNADVRPSKRARREDAATSETAQLPTLGSAARCAPAPDYGAAKGEAYNKSDPRDRITVPMLPLKF